MPSVSTLGTWVDARPLKSTRLSPEDTANGSMVEDFVAVVKGGSSQSITALVSKKLPTPALMRLWGEGVRYNPDFIRTKVSSSFSLAYFVSFLFICVALPVHIIMAQNKRGAVKFLQEIQTLNFSVYSINEVIIQTQNFFFHNCCSETKTRAPEYFLKLERWQGPPHINKVKKYEIVLSFKVSLFRLRTSVGEGLSPQTKMSSPKLHIAPLSPPFVFSPSQFAAVIKLSAGSLTWLIDAKTFTIKSVCGSNRIGTITARQSTDQ